MYFLKNIFLLLLLLQYSWANDKELEQIFQKAQIKGTLVLTTLDGKESYIYNTKRALTQYIPASTFKIPNTLIALEEKIIQDEYETIKWDGKIRDYEAWNKDQNLQTAIAVSCVWCYEKFAQSIGKEKYLEYLKKIDYGNKKVGKSVSKFWLVGDIKISAIEEIEFLQRLYKNQLPFTQKNLDIIKKILIVEKTENYTIYAKSGWSGKIGWYVGYLQKANQVWFFAFNGDINKNQLHHRKEIVINALKLKGIL